MLILRGSPAFSEFRLQKLLQDIISAGLPVRALSAEFVHVAELTSDLSAAQREILEKILTYGPSRPEGKIEGLVQVVAPRPGTLSPWSSKATDIAHTCGLAAVRRNVRDGRPHPGPRHPRARRPSGRVAMQRQLLLRCDNALSKTRQAVSGLRDNASMHDRPCALRSHGCHASASLCSNARLTPPVRVRPRWHAACF